MASDPTKLPLTGVLPVLVPEATVVTEGGVPAGAEFEAEGTEAGAVEVAGEAALAEGLGETDALGDVYVPRPGPGLTDIVRRADDGARLLVAQAREGIAETATTLRTWGEDLRDEGWEDLRYWVWNGLWDGAYGLFSGLDWLLAGTFELRDRLSGRPVAPPTLSLSPPVAPKPEPPRPQPRLVFDPAHVHFSLATGALSYRLAEGQEPIDVSHALRDPIDLMRFLLLFTATPDFEMQRLMEVLEAPLPLFYDTFGDIGRMRTYSFMVPSYGDSTGDSTFTDRTWRVRLTVSVVYDLKERRLRMEISGLLPGDQGIAACWERRGQRAGHDWQPLYVKDKMFGHDPAIFPILHPPGSLRSRTADERVGIFTRPMTRLEARIGFCRDLSSMLFMTEHGPRVDEFLAGLVAASGRPILDPDGSLSAALEPAGIGRFTPGAGVCLSNDTLVVVDKGGISIFLPGESEEKQPLHLMEALDWLEGLADNTREVTFLPMDDPLTGGCTVFVYAWDSPAREWKILGQIYFGSLGAPLLPRAGLEATRSITAAEFGLSTAETARLRAGDVYFSAQHATQSRLVRPRFMPLTVVAPSPTPETSVTESMATIYVDEVASLLVDVMEDEEGFFWGVDGCAIFAGVAAPRLSFAGFVCDAAARQAMQAYFAGQRTPAVLATLRARFIFSESQPVPLGTSAAAAARFVDVQDERAVQALAANALCVRDRTAAGDHDAFLVFFDMRPGQGTPDEGEPDDSGARSKGKDREDGTDSRLGV